MAIQTINIGTIANDGTGDDLREAFVKVNNNFTELDTRDPEKTTGANLGSAGEGVFAQLNGAEMQFKKLIAGTATTLVVTVMLLQLIQQPPVYLNYKYLPTIIILH